MDLVKRITVWAAIAVSMALNVAHAECFSDTSWQQLQNQSQQQPALLYVWSPRMVLSVQHAAEVASVAEQQGLRFVPVVDGRISAQEIADTLPAGHLLQASPALCSPQLENQYAYRHFPTAWVVQHGTYHPQPLVSAMPPQWWRKGIQLRMEQP